MHGPIRIRFRKKCSLFLHITTVASYRELQKAVRFRRLILWIYDHRDYVHSSGRPLRSTDWEWLFYHRAHRHRSVRPPGSTHWYCNYSITGSTCTVPEGHKAPLMTLWLFYHRTYLHNSGRTLSTAGWYCDYITTGPTCTTRQGRSVPPADTVTIYHTAHRHIKSPGSNGWYCDYLTTGRTCTALEAFSVPPADTVCVCVNCMYHCLPLSRFHACLTVMWLADINQSGKTSPWQLTNISLCSIL